MNVLLYRSMAGAVMICMMISVVVASLGLPLGTHVVERLLKNRRSGGNDAPTTWRWKLG